MKSYKINFYEFDNISLSYERFTVMEFSRNYFSSRDLRIVVDELCFLAGTAKKSIGEVVAVIHNEKKSFMFARIFLDGDFAVLQFSKPNCIYKTVRTMNRVNL